MRKNLLTLLAAVSISATGWSAETTEQQGQAPQLQPKMEMKVQTGEFSSNGSRAISKLKEIRKARPDLYSGRVIDVAQIYNSQWDDMGYSAPYGLYKMDMGSGEAQAVITDPFSYSFAAGAYSDKEFLGMRIVSAFGAFNGLNFVSIDTEAKKENYNIMLSLEEVTYGDICSTIAYNPVNDTFYSFNYNDTMDGLNICRFDAEQRKFVSFETWKGTVQPLTMAFSPRGVCYVICNDGALYTVNMNTGAITLVGQTGVLPSMYTQAMAYDGTTGNFIWTAITNRGSRIYAVDPTTAEVEEIAALGDNQQFAAASLPLNAAYYGAPAKVSSIGYNASSGSTEGTVSFSTPATTFGGAAMSGDLTYTLWVDGQIVAENVRTSTGQYISVPVNLAEGNHVFGVMTSNKTGDSPIANATYWVGFDYPAAPEYVNLEAKDGNFNISWASVYKGQHNGYVDWQVKYNVYRMPDNVKVASEITTTSCTDPIPAVMKRYYYEVAAVNSDGKEGARMASPEMLQGNSATIPYFEGFEDDTYQDIWRFVDRTGNDRKWRLQPGEIDADMMQGANDMWAIVPPVAIEAGNKYQMTLNMRKAWHSYNDRVKVYIGKKGADLDEFVELAEFTDNMPTDFADVTLDFSVAESGDYEFGIAACAEENGSTVRISSVAIDLLGKLGAPEAVTDITVVPDAEDALEATISFKAPSTTLNNETLASISHFDILVDGEKASTITDVTPGATVTKTITGIKNVGKHIFSIVPFNEAGKGKIATASQFIGCYTAPYTETFEDKSGLEFWTDNYNFDTSDLFSVPMTWNQYYKALEVVWFANNADEKAWVFSPDLKLDAESVYTLTFDFTNQHYGDDSTYTLNIGHGANPESQSKLQDLPMTDAYNKATPVDVEVVTEEAGKYNFGFYSYSTKAYDYPSYQIKNFKLTYLTSSKAPYSITDYKGVADKTGKLEADLSFKAPAVDFRQQALASIDKIEILRGDNGMVVKTFDNPTPGAELTWHDNSANYGKNNYTIVAYNSEGRGKIYAATLFVGEDVPAVENISLVGSDDNMSATLSWNRTEFGVNGGILMDEDMKYQVFQFDAESQSASIIATVTDNSYTFPAVSSQEQAYYYYGVIPVNDINAGSPVILSVQLGKLYSLPFSESFPNGIPQTALWSIYSQHPYINWQPMNGFWDGYDAQDNDGGCIGFFNGSMYASYAGDRLYTPKFCIKDYDAKLTFYVLDAREAGSEEYPYPGLLRVGINVDDTDFVTITKDEDYEFDGTDTNWKKYEIDLTPYKNSKHVRLCFDGWTNGGHEVLYVDNISVTGEYSGINSVAGDAKNPAVSGERGMITIMNAAGADVEIYDLSGVLTARHTGADMMNIPASQGIYIVKVADKVFKVHVK